MSLRNKILIAISVLILCCASFFLFRQPVLKFIIHKVQDKVNERYHAKLIIGESGFSGLRGIYLKDLSLIPPDNDDTLITINKINATLRLSRLLRFQLAFRELALDTIIFNLVKPDSLHSNYSFLFNRSENKLTHTINAGGLNDRFKMLFRKVNDIFNENITVRSFIINFQYEANKEMVKIPELYLDGLKFQVSVITSSLEGVNLWLLKGKADADNGKYELNIKRIRGASFALPFADLIDNFKVCFDEAQIRFEADNTADIVPVKADFEMHNLLINHWRISPEDVLMPLINFHLNANIAEDSIQFYKGTHFTLNRLPVNITFSYSRKPEEHLTLDQNFNVSDANDLFSSLPEGMFHTFKGFRASGELAYSMHFDLLRNHPDDLSFDSELKKKNFKIIQYGTENFSRMAAPFSFIAMDGERPVRSFTVGTENPDFTPYDQISDYLKNTVLTSEDPSFFNHSGFVEESFKESIITNIKQGRFARGGSTISMQLVKNIHLSRNKTIARKLEEALIVWLIEQNRLVSKERMFEVYLNIIEWGPGIYGIGEASHFYFNKTAKDLSLSESVYLSSLIPHPKYFKYSFDTAGNLKPFMANYFKLVAGRLVKREKITQSEADSLKPEVKLMGNALKFVLPPDTIPVDTLELEDFQLNK